jgi:hypothetical protein
MKKIVSGVAPDTTQKDYMSGSGIPGAVSQISFLMVLLKKVAVAVTYRLS